MAAQLPGQLGVAAGRAAGNLLQGLPDALLEGRAANVQRQVGGAFRLLQLPEHLLQPVVQGALILLQPGCGEALLQFGEQRRRVVAEQQGADALVAARQ